MHKLQELPPGVAMPHIAEQIATRPNSLFGMKVEWSSHEPVIPLLLACFSTQAGKAPDDTNAVFLFGACYGAVGALLDGTAMPADTRFVEYFVARHTRSKSGKVARLTQQHSDTYSSTDESDDYKPARSIRSVASLSVHHPPRWKSAAAIWPTYRGSPMKFLGQVPLHESELTRRFFRWDINVYLFWDANADVFKVVDQEMELQTEDDHVLGRKVKKIT